MAVVALWLAEGLFDALVLGRGLGYFLDDKFQLQVNTLTTIVTFLLVALLQNAQTRADQATQHKLNAVADAQADQMLVLADMTEDVALAGRLREQAGELRGAVGLELRESTS